MISDMSKREKVLAAVVGGTLFVLLNVVRLKLFITANADLKLELSNARTEIARNEARETDRAMWAERDQWLNQNMQRLDDADTANQKMSNTLKELGKKFGIIPESPSQGLPINLPHYTSLSFGIQCKGSWASIFDFIRELQGPGQFIVFESAKLEIDPAEKTQMKADLRVAQWYAPRAAR